MNELNALLYGTVKNDSEWQTLTGATSKDPRFYKQFTPVKVKVNKNKPGYGVYHLAGAAKPGDYIHGAQKFNQIYSVEVYSKTDVLLTQLCDRIADLFDDGRFTTPSYIIGWTYSGKSAEVFQDSRKLYTSVVTVYLNNVYIST
jgi:hypothetical protein